MYTYIMRATYRVGARIKTRTAGRRRSRQSNRSKIGNTNAAVLPVLCIDWHYIESFLIIIELFVPDPVTAEPQMSKPFKATGIVVC